MKTITKEMIEDFQCSLIRAERSAGTIEKYLRDVRAFAAWLDGREVTRELLAEWKASLLETHKAKTVNSMIAAVNALFVFLGWEECRSGYLRVQKETFRSEAREMTRTEYERLLAAAYRNKKERLGLIIETICATGIRVSETEHITVEALREERADISLKGKVRTIMIPKKLCRKLLKYAKRQGIASGPVFLTRNATTLSRKQIWAEMKALCELARVEATKVFPHNLRHLFARTFYRACKDIALLADVLGHSSIETTRIYLISTGAEHRKRLERLGLVI